MADPVHPRTSKVYTMLDDGSLKPIDPNESNGSPVFKVAPANDPTNIYGLALRAAEKWGILSVVVLGLGWFAFTLSTWQREDQRAFVSAIQRNTTVLESMATEQRANTEALKGVVRKLEDLERSHHRRDP